MSADPKDDHVRLLEEAEQRIREQLARMQATLAANGAAVPSSLPTMAVNGHTYRVFRHDQLGHYMVLRDIEVVNDCTCVSGPTRADGGDMTFAEALAFANQAFTARTQEQLVAMSPAKFLEASAAELAREAKRLAELYVPPARSAPESAGRG